MGYFGPHSQSIYLNNGVDDWETSTSYYIPDGLIDRPTSNNLITIGGFLDADGDVLPDYIRTALGDSTHLHTGTSSGWNTSSSHPLYVFPQDFWQTWSGSDITTNLQIGDADADGLLDVLGKRKQVWLRTTSGTNWIESPDIELPFKVSTQDYGNNGIMSLDANGDGLVDMVSSNAVFGSNGLGVYMHSGFNIGWLYDSNFDIDFAYDDIGDGFSAINVVDINADGLIDIYKSHENFPITLVENKAFINAGNNNGWEYDSSYVVPLSSAHNAMIYNTGFEIRDHGYRFLDVNADGILDVIHRYNNMTAADTELYLGKGVVPDLLVGVQHSSGASTTIEYKPSSHYKDVNGDLLNPEARRIIQTPHVILTNDGTGNVSETTYTYIGAEQYYNGPYDRAFGGFGEVIIEDTDGNITKQYFHQGNGSNTTLGEYADNKSKIGRMYREEVFDDADNLYQRTITKWDSTSLGNERFYIYPTDVLTQTYDGDLDHKDVAESYAYNTANGNITTHTVLGEVSGNSNGTFTDTGTDKRTTSYSYATDGGDVVGYVSQKDLSDYGSVLVSSQKYYYDGLTHGQVTNGNQTKYDAWISSGTGYQTQVQRTFNSYGLAITEEDGLGNITSSTYDTYNLYPVTIENALQQENNFEYDYSSGQIRLFKNANGHEFVTVYDGFDRVVEETQPDVASPSTQVTKKTVTYYDNASPRYIHSRAYLTASDYVDEYAYVDGFDRPIQVRKEAEDGSKYAVTDYIYTDDGQLEKESLPYFSSGSSKTTATAVGDLYTEYTYDPLGRITIAETVLGQTQYSFDDWNVEITDTESNTKELEHDAFGQLITVTEYLDAQGYDTEYKYNVLGNLTQVTDANDNVRNFEYDGLGRRISFEDIHDPTDMSFGEWEYTYDAASNVLTQTDANGQVVTYTYDDLNRILTEDADGSADVEITYTYDTCTNGVGSLCLAVSYTSSTVSTTYEYDPLLRVNSEILEVDAQVFETETTYDRQGNIVSIEYPNNATVDYSFNDAGLINGLSYNAYAAVSDITYAPTGLPLFTYYANGVEIKNTYDPSQLYRLVNKSSTSTATTTPFAIQNISYTYDDVGNILEISEDAAIGAERVMTYTYDDLYRLIEVEELGHGTIRAYDYDILGNMISSSHVGVFQHAETGNANPHAATNIAGLNLSYDQNGNVTQIGNRYMLFWDYKNRMTKSLYKAGANPVRTDEYRYNYMGDRVSKFNASSTTYYPTKYTEKTGSTFKNNIYVNDTLVITINYEGAGPKPHFNHGDHLGGSSVITNLSGEVVQVLDYYPFGAIRVNDQTGTYDQTHKFTGHEYDDETDLNYMGARYQLPFIGRFMSQDPAYLAVGQDSLLEGITGGIREKYLSDPQSLHSYSYARNNPLKNVDATGMYWETVIDLVFLGLSVYDFNREKSVINGIFLGLDAFGVATPLPAVAGYTKNGIRGYRIAKYFEKVASSIDDVINLGELFIKNAAFKFNRRPWSIGEARNDVASLVGHFYKHGDNVGARDVGDYYNKANDFIDSKRYTNSWEEGTDTVYYNSKNNLIGITNENGDISSYYKVTHPDKLDSIKSKIKK